MKNIGVVAQGDVSLFNMWFEKAAGETNL